MDSVDQILDFAIEREEVAVAFYTDLAEAVKLPQLERVLLGFAKEEQRHKERLLAVKEGAELRASPKMVVDLKIADYVVDVAPGANLDYQDALIVAMKREQVAHRLYTDLAEKIESPRLKETFLALAQEEARHKLYFEKEYDEHVLKDN